MEQAGLVEVTKQKNKVSVSVEVIAITKFIENLVSNNNKKTRITNPHLYIVNLYCKMPSGKMQRKNFASHS